MSTMRMPGFTAEASVYKTSRHYMMTEEPAHGWRSHPSGAVSWIVDVMIICRSTCDCSDLGGKKKENASLIAMPIAVGNVPGDSSFL